VRDGLSLVFNCTSAGVRYTKNPISARSTVWPKPAWCAVRRTHGRL